MKLIIGLGNPTEKYKFTRHNIGKLIVKEFQRKADFPEFELKKKTKALISKKGGIIIALPETFMNSSGVCVKLLTKHYSINHKSLIVFHDDFDLELGKLRISKNRSSGGHKGVQSIIDELKTKEFVRFRIGIKPKRPPKDLDKFVLKKFTKQEKQTIEKVIKKSIKALEVALEQGLEKAMNEFNE